MGNWDNFAKWQYFPYSHWRLLAKFVWLIKLLPQLRVSIFSHNFSVMLLIWVPFPGKVCTLSCQKPCLYNRGSYKSIKGLRFKGWLMVGSRDYVLKMSRAVLHFMPRWVTRRSLAQPLQNHSGLRGKFREKNTFRKVKNMGDPFSVTLVGGAPWGIRIAGGKDFNTPLVIRYFLFYSFYIKV